MEVPNNVKIFRIERGLSLRDLARLSGVSASSISQIEKFERSPTQATMLSISCALKVDTHVVFNLCWRNCIYSKNV